MLLITLLPHVYALLLTFLFPWQIKAQLRRLESIGGSGEQLDEWIEHAVFESTMLDFVRAPLVAVLPTVVRTLEQNAPVLTGVAVFLLVALSTIFGLVRANWDLWHLNRTYVLFRLRVRGTTLLSLAKASVIVAMAVITLLA